MHSITKKYIKKQKHKKTLRHLKKKYRGGVKVNTIAPSPNQNFSLLNSFLIDSPVENNTLNDTSINTTTSIETSSPLPPQDIVFMYDRYKKMPNHQYNKYLKSIYLSNPNLYLDTVNNATCSSRNTFTAQAQQEFVSYYINSNTPYRGLLVWHGLGSGKTCTSIVTANMNTDRNVVVVAPAALIPNFIGDYNNLCGNTNRATYNMTRQQEKGIPKNHINLPNDIKVFSSNGDINFYKSKFKDKFEDKLIIIDEAQILIEHITNAIRKNYKLRKETLIEKYCL